MFKKKPSIKALSPLRSSDRRKLADQIIADLDISHSKLAEDASADQKAAHSAELTVLRNSILPENALSAKFTTTHGPDLQQVSGTVYVGTHQGDEQRILWVKIGNSLFPTVYTLWRNAQIVPLLHTPNFVISKLQGGADLMTPGLAGGPPFPAKAKKGAVVAIASLESPSVPLVVGRCEIDVSALEKVQGAKGHAVQSITWFGDELWAWSSGGKAGGEAPEVLQDWLKSDQVDEITEKTDQLVVQDSGIAKELNLAGNGSQIQENRDKEITADGEAVESVENRIWTTKDVDDAFRKAFLYGVHSFMEHGNPPHYGMNFPLNQSLVMSSLIQPFLPVFTKSDSDALQFKKTSWKNIKKFIKSLGQDRLILVKEGKDESIILDIDFEDIRFKEFVPYPVPKKESPPAASSGNSNSSSAIPSDSSLGQQLNITVLYKAKEKYSDLFIDSDYHRYYTAAELRNIVFSYVDQERLVSPENRRMVALNPFIANNFVDGSHPNDKLFIHKGFIPRDTLVEQFLSRCSPYHLISRGTSALEENQKPKAGQPPKIVITMETRGGNKTVTKVSGLEAYYVPPQPLADELRKVCAGSTSVEKLIGSSDKNPVMEVMVQGPQKDAILKALEKRGVDKKWVDVVDKTKKKKK